METSTIISLGALAVAVVGLMLNSRRDTRTDAASLAIIQTKLNTVISGVEEIRVDNKAIQKELSQHGQKLVELEQRMKSNTHRLDQLEGKREKGEE